MSHFSPGWQTLLDLVSKPVLPRGPPGAVGGGIAP